MNRTRRSVGSDASEGSVNKRERRLYERIPMLPYRSRCSGKPGVARTGHSFKHQCEFKVICANRD